MKVGLLLCDEVNVRYQTAFGTYPKMFGALFPDYDIELFDVRNGVFPSSEEDFDVYMTTGSVHSVYEKLEWIEQTKVFIRALYEKNKYYIGVCFGHQLLTEALGGKVGKAPVGWCVGIHQFEVLQKKEWMNPFQQNVNFLMMCQDQILRLPEAATCLAGNEDCPNALIQIGERMLSIQAHPEFTKAYDKILMQDRIARIGKEKVKNGLNSLQLDLDTELFRKWVNAFLLK